MNFAKIPLSKIEVGERARKELGDLSDLRDSAKGFMGQIQSLAVCEKADGSGYHLLAGGRRLHAFAEAGIEEVLCRIYPATLTIEQRKAIELKENTARMSMSWQEEAKLVKEIHENKLQVLGVHTPTNPEGWSQARTAALLGVSPPTITSTLRLAEALEALPVLSKAKSRKDALNAIAMFEEREVIKELELRTAPLRAQREEALCARYSTGDAVERLQRARENSFHLCEVDPDYAINFEKLAGITSGHKFEATVARTGYVATTPNEFIAKLHTVLTQCYRILREDGWLILWYGMDPWHEKVINLVRQVGFQCNGIPALWTKDAEGRLSSFPDYYLGSAYETFIYARKSKSLVAKRGRANVFNFPVRTKQRIHPCEKPLELMAEILRTFALPGARVYSPFAGSGNTLLAAHQLGMYGIGCDLNESYRMAYNKKVHELFEEKEKEGEEK